MTRLVVVRIAAVALMGLSATACGDGLGKTPPSTSQTPPSSQPVAVNDKYTGNLPKCPVLAQQVPGLPPIQRDADEPTSADMNVHCEFSATAGPFVAVDVAAWKSGQGDPRFPAEVGRGRGMARDRFAAGKDAVDDGVADVLGLGEKAKWQYSATYKGCFLTILDANAVLRVRYDVLGGTTLDPKSEQCRGPLAELAKPIYEALQPR